MTLSKEKLAHYAMHTDGSVKAMARELLERRGRDKQEPDGWQFLGVNGLWVSVTENGMREALKEGCEVRPLYAAPQLTQPAVVSNASRENFEAWARSAGFNENWYFFTNTHPNHYDDDHINDMWAAWNACRAAMLQGAEPVQAVTQLECNLSQANIGKLADVILEMNSKPGMRNQIIAEPAQGWIPCSERMPDETQPVIVVSDGGVVQRTVYQFCEGVWIDWYEQYDEVSADAFTHWMPLPAAPQQEV